MVLPDNITRVQIDNGSRITAQMLYFLQTLLKLDNIENPAPQKRGELPNDRTK